MVNVHGNFSRSVAFLKKMSSEETALGACLQSVLTDPKIWNMLTNKPIPDVTSNTAPKLVISQDEYLATVHMFVNAACLVTVFCWANLMDDLACQHRALQVICLLQDLESHREVGLFNSQYGHAQTHPFLLRF